MAQQNPLSGDQQTFRARRGLSIAYEDPPETIVPTLSYSLRGRSLYNHVSRYQLTPVLNRVPRYMRYVDRNLRLLT
jgi:hypothetical protein